MHSPAQGAGLVFLHGILCLLPGNMIKIIQFGQIQIALTAYTRATQASLTSVLQLLPENIRIVEATSDVKWAMHIISTDPNSSERFSIKDNRQGLWRKLHLQSIGLETSHISSFFSIQSGPNQEETEFIHFVSNKRSVEEESVFILTHLGHVINRWLMVNGNISLHASTIIHHRYGFLFLGQSGAGKSTIAKLSCESSKVVHDEKIFLYPEDGRYVLSNFSNMDEVGESDETNLMVRTKLTTGSKIYLSGIFILCQDKEDRLEPLPKRTTAKRLMDSYFELPRVFTLLNPEICYSMKTLSQTARDIPAFELHFRKSPDFWQLIDEQFPS
jgi:hypothetical protein